MRRGAQARGRTGKNGTVWTLYKKQRYVSFKLKFSFEEVATEDFGAPPQPPFAISNLENVRKMIERLYSPHHARDNSLHIGF